MVGKTELINLIIKLNPIIKMSIAINNKIFKLIILCIVLLNFASLKSQEITGDWKFKNKYIDIELFLVQNDNIITGGHCIVYGQNGDYLDCSDEGNTTLSGTLKNNILSLTITSEYSGNKGKIELEILSSNSLRWRLIKEPEGVFFYPKEAILVRESSSSKPLSKEEGSISKEKPKEEEKESKLLPRWELKSSNYDKGYFDGGSAYEQCKKEQGKEREFLDGDKRMPIEGMGSETVEYQAEFQRCKKGFFYGIKWKSNEYRRGFEEGWRDASMPLNKEKETIKKK